LRLLVARDLFFGRSRFKDFVASPEGISTNILSERLERLERLERPVRHGVAERVPASDGSKRFGYQLTKKGRSLGPVLEAMRDWGLAWGPATEAPMSEIEAQ